MVIKGSMELMDEVVDTGLCAFCGGCTGACPYRVTYKGRVVLLDNCTISDGQCYTYCPRTYTDMDAMSKKIFGVPYSEDEIGTAREIFLARSTDAKVQEKGQDGGVVTALLLLALSEGIIDGAVETRMDEDKIPHGFIARNRQEVLECAGVSYEPSPVLEVLNSLPQENGEKLAVVGIPCQLASVAKMKTLPPKNRMNIDNVKLVLGLFCGWSLADGFHELLQENHDLSKVVKFDIPHHPGHTFDMYSKSGKESIEIEDLRDYINEACGYCWDMTAEFADISVGSGRAKFKGWNTVVVRSKAGAELMEIARKKGVVETQPIPAESVENLKRASLNKKKRALSSIIGKTGDKKDLLYLGIPSGLADKLLAQ